MEHETSRHLPHFQALHRPNLTGIPTQMKLDLETRSGLPLDDVRVHYHSDLPARVGALAYTQAPHVYMGPGQEVHLLHELCHVVQQKSGQVHPTRMEGTLAINDDPALERMADAGIVERCSPAGCPNGVVQRVAIPNIQDVAKNRFCHLYTARLATNMRDAINNPARSDAENFAAALQHLYQNNTSSATIQTRLEACGVAAGLAAQMSQMSWSDAESTFDVHYSAFNNDLSRDVNSLTPPPRTTGPATRSTYLLGVLSRSLNGIAMPRVQQAENNGRTARQAGRLSGGPIRNFANYTNPSLWDRFSRWFNRNDLIEGTERFNQLLLQPAGPAAAAQRMPPTVYIAGTSAGGYTLQNIGESIGHQRYGIATGPSQVVHEHGHLLEDRLGTDDFANLHRFLRGRSRSRQQRPTGWGTLTGSGLGYDAVLPPMEFQNWFSRSVLPSGNSPLNFVLYNLGNWILSQLTWAASLSCARERGQQFIDDFFLQESNSEGTSYATQINGRNYGTEFVSTTAELLSTQRGARALFAADPTRAALFFYLTNRDLYHQLDQRFQQLHQLPNQSLSDFLHLL